MRTLVRSAGDVLDTGRNVATIIQVIQTILWSIN